MCPSTTVEPTSTPLTVRRRVPSAAGATPSKVSEYSSKGTSSHEAYWPSPEPIRTPCSVRSSSAEDSVQAPRTSVDTTAAQHNSLIILFMIFRLEIQ